jgi:hypothetical protein
MALASVASGGALQMGAAWGWSRTKAPCASTASVASEPSPHRTRALSQSWLLEAKSKNRLSEAIRKYRSLNL